MLAGMARAPGTSALETYRGARKHRARAAVWCGVAGAVAGLGLARAGGLGRGAAAGAAGAGFLVGLAAWLGLAPDSQSWRRGAAGERDTARLLEQLPRRRWRVWHDLLIPGSQANIDHLAIGPTGVWVIDSKVTGAAVRARPWGVKFGTRRLDTTSTRWESQVVSDRLGVPVRTVVAVHASRMEGRRGRAAGVRVIPAEMLVPWLRRRLGRRRLGRREVERLSARVDRALLGPGDSRVRAARSWHA
jgi:hypothetical protein